MARSRPLTMRHLAVTVLVVVLVNAQLTWWIILVLRQNRSLLEHERDRLTDAAVAEATRVRDELDSARDLLMEWIVTRKGWGSSGIWRWSPDPEPPPAPFVGWADADPVYGKPGWHRMDDGRLRFEFPDGGVVRGAVVDAQWTEALLRVDERLEIVHGDAGRLEESARPVVALPSPLADLAVVPSEDAWEEVLDVYRRRILMMVSEGTFFAIMLFVLIGLLWRTLRREVELQRQHRNFLSAITHELKSPLAGTRLALETVISGRADAAASERFLGNAVRDVDRLQGMVQQVLETTRYGHGGRLELRRSDISEIVEASIADIRPRVEVLEGEIVSEVEPRCFAGVEVEGFTIVISNLLDNAVKYGGRPPRVVVSLRLEGDWAILEVSDNGAGVAEDDETSIFERFYRSGDELSRTTHGTGLGLYLVQQIVRAHRGTVGVAATGPDGTTFRVEIPGAELKESGP